MEVNDAVPTDQYTVFGSRLSIFTMKLVAAMEWYFQDEYMYRVKGRTRAPDTDPAAAVLNQLTATLTARAGTRQMPVLITPENWCIADTTPILAMLDGRMAEPRLYPVGIVGALAAVMEEYFDEWAVRWCLHVRFQCGDQTAEHGAAGLMGERNPAILAHEVARKIKWGREVAAPALGLTSHVQQSAVEAEMLRVLGALDGHFASGHHFVFGDAPTAVDCVLMGILRAHLFHDLYSRELLRHHDGLRRWHDSAFGAAVPPSATVTSRPVSLDTLSPFCALVLEEMGRDFARFAEGSRDAYSTGRESFTATVYGESVSYLHRPYVEKSRRMLRKKLAVHLRRCSLHDRDAFGTIMRHYGLADLYLPDSVPTPTSRL